jgi:hypothetical protein
MVLPDGDDASSLAGSLAASAEALTASQRSAALPPEHRLRADRSFALALGTLFASIAPEHALLRPMGIVARRRALAREVLASRLDAAATLSLARGLAQRPATGDEDVLAQAALGPAPFPAIPRRGSRSSKRSTDSGRSPHRADQRSAQNALRKSLVS